MPLDGPTHAFDQDPEIEIYFDRRWALAEMLAALPAGAFNLRYYGSCALGWLAQQRIDGWHFCLGVPVRSRYNPFAVYRDAGAYFGLTTTEAFAVFSTQSQSVYGHGPRAVTAAEVTDKLLAMPIRIGGRF